MDPFPLDHPVTFPLGFVAIQEKVVPVTIEGASLIETVAVFPLHIVRLDAVAVGTGLTVTIRSTGVPSQPLLWGIM